MCASTDIFEIDGLLFGGKRAAPSQSAWRRTAARRHARLCPARRGDCGHARYRVAGPPAAGLCVLPLGQLCDQGIGRSAQLHDERGPLAVFEDRAARERRRREALAILPLGPDAAASGFRATVVRATEAGAIRALLPSALRGRQANQVDQDFTRALPGCRW